MAEQNTSQDPSKNNIEQEFTRNIIQAQINSLTYNKNLLTYNINDRMYQMITTRVRSLAEVVGCRRYTLAATDAATGHDTEAILEYNDVVYVHKKHGEEFMAEVEMLLRVSSQVADHSLFEVTTMDIESDGDLSEPIRGVMYAPKEPDPDGSVVDDEIVSISDNSGQQYSTHGQDLSIGQGGRGASPTASNTNAETEATSGDESESSDSDTHYPVAHLHPSDARPRGLSARRPAPASDDDDDDDNEDPSPAPKRRRRAVPNSGVSSSVGAAAGPVVQNSGANVPVGVVAGPAVQNSGANASVGVAAGPAVSQRPAQYLPYFFDLPAGHGQVLIQPGRNNPATNTITFVAQPQHINTLLDLIKEGTRQMRRRLLISDFKAITEAFNRHFSGTTYIVNGQTRNFEPRGYNNIHSLFEKDNSRTTLIRNWARSQNLY